MFVLHGIYGAGRNWASIARRFVQRRNEWGIVLVDLRLHAGSQGFPPPHTLAACAADLARLAEPDHASLNTVSQGEYSFGAASQGEDPVYSIPDPAGPAAAAAPVNDDEIGLGVGVGPGSTGATYAVLPAQMATAPAEAVRQISAPGAALFIHTVDCEEAETC